MANKETVNFPMSTTQVATVQITCINKPDRNSSHESITHLGNSQGKWTKEQVIAWIDAKQFSFYTQDRFGTAWSCFRCCCRRGQEHCEPMGDLRLGQ